MSGGGADQGRTHEVHNQVPPLEDVNFYATDRPLREAVALHGAAWAEDRLWDYGALAGGPMLALGVLANENPPRLRTHDRSGQRIDVVEYHPAYHELMALAVGRGLHCAPWADPRPGAHVARGALAYLHGQAEAGTSCPLTMTFSSVPSLRRQPDVGGRWLDKLLRCKYDPANRPVAEKDGVTIGMAMTEKQGGSDVRANTTRARALEAPGAGRPYELVGHKWFCSAPMCDAFLTLAQAEGGLSCFLLPRWRPDGTKNAFELQRLKAKLGNHANASSEVEFRGAYAELIGDEGRGVSVIIEMVAMTRFDCMVGSAALMRQATSQAIHHATHRSAFGRKLIEQPLMVNVLADLALESEAAMVLAMRVAQALDRGAESESERLLARLAVAVGKYWVCKRAPVLVNEAQECLGGAGYVEESILPRLYREAPLNSIWEGSGNVQCLDVLRALRREPGVRDAWLTEVRGVAGESRIHDDYVDRVARQLDSEPDAEHNARRLVERLALALQASQLIRAGNPQVRDAFLASRLAGNHGQALGTLSSNVDCTALVRRSQLQ